MAHYLLSVCYPAGAIPPSPGRLAAIGKELDVLNAEMKSKGLWVFGGALLDPASASVVRSANGEVLVTDGPFIETKEQIGGIVVLDAADENEARRWAAKVAAVIGVPIEVRPMQQH